jgi:hypothetical protein
MIVRSETVHEAAAAWHCEFAKLAPAQSERTFSIKRISPLFSDRGGCVCRQTNRRREDKFISVIQYSGKVI